MTTEQPNGNPLQRGMQGFREWARLPSAATFPADHAVVMALAAVVGLFAGLAAGLFANLIALFQVLFFRPGALLRVVTGGNAEWTRHFEDELARAPWHLEFVVIAVLGVVVSRVLARLVERRHVKLPAVLQARRIRAIGWLLGLGLVLFYPLLLLTTFNRAFGSAHGGFLAMVERVPMVWRALIPALGGLAAGLLVRHFSPESGGHGVVEVIEAVRVRGAKRIPTPVAIWKAITAGLVIGSGGSAGREGPVVQIGGAIANGLAVRFGLTREQLTLLLACGGGAGIAASFNSPIGGTFFALEILLGDFGMRSVAPVAFASVAATITGRSLIGAGGEIVHIPFTVASGIEIGPYVVLGVLAAGVAVLYVRAVHGVEHAFAKGPRLSRIRPELRPMVGGLAVGFLGLAIPQVLGNGYETMNGALVGALPAGLLLVILLGKIVASGLTLGSGAPGGSFFPAVFMGAVLGGAVGTVGHAWFPTFVAGPGAYAAVGMAAVVAAATQAPLTAILMLFELTGSYEIILPLMIACTTSVAGAHWVLHGSMYTLKLRERGLHLPTVRADVLERVDVSQVMTPEVVTVRASATFDEVLALVRATRHSAFPVLDEAGLLMGLLMVEELRPFLGGEHEGRPATAGACARLAPPVAHLDEHVELARQRMLATGFSHLPVVDRRAPRVLVGILSHRDVLTAFEELVTAAAEPVEETLPPRGRGTE